MLLKIFSTRLASSMKNGYRVSCIWLEIQQSDSRTISSKEKWMRNITELGSWHFVKGILIFFLVRTRETNIKWENSCNWWFNFLREIIWIKFILCFAMMEIRRRDAYCWRGSGKKKQDTHKCSWVVAIPLHISSITRDLSKIVLRICRNTSTREQDFTKVYQEGSTLWGKVCPISL